MKSLFTEPTERFTEDANSFSAEIEAAIRPIMVKYIEKGYKIRELSGEAMASAYAVGLYMLLAPRAKQKLDGQ